MTDNASFSRGSPELSEHLIHFVRRSGVQPNVSDEIAAMDGSQRIESILSERTIWAHNTYYSAGVPVVCFTEATNQNIEWAIEERGYEPWGLVFSKQSVWDAGGAPVMYSRPDNQHHFREMSDEIRSKIVSIDPPSGTMWMHEREWRITYLDGGGYEFRTEDVEAVIVGDDDWYPQEMAMVYDPYEDWIPMVVPSDWAMGIPRFQWTPIGFLSLD